MSIIDTIGAAATTIVDTAGAAGVAAVMALEAALPVPSEVLLPLVGTQVAAGQLTFAVAVLAATVGSTLGAWAMHTVGKVGGRGRVQRLAHLIGLDDARWTRLETWFERQGSWVVFLGRLVPGVRVLVNLPAGSMGMPTARFLALTAAGSALWNAVWIGAGSALTTHWDGLLDAVADTRPAVLTAAVAGVVVVLAQQTRGRLVLG